MFRGCSKSDNPHRRDFLAVVVFIVLFAAAIVLSHVYESEIASIGNWFLSRFDRTSIYIALFIVAALSSGLLPLPVWIYVVTCVALGASLLECSLTVGLGASLGSASSYGLGRYFSNSRLVKRRIDDRAVQKWKSQSRWYCCLALLFGSASPIPMDVFYLISGLIKFPALMFISLVSVGRVARYMIIGYVFSLSQ